MGSLHSAIREGERTLVIYEAFKVRTAPPVDELADDEELGLPTDRQGDCVRDVLAEDISSARTMLQGLDDKVRMLDTLVDAVEGRDVPTLSAKIKEGEGADTYEHCADSLHELAVAQALLEDLQQKMAKIESCFFKDHKLHAMGTSQDDGW